MKGKERRMFPGGNTSRGFFSYYNHIINKKDANKIIILKGGPGTGKSSMMRKIGMYMQEKGYDVEYHHCSSDRESIDSIMIPKLKVAVVDGTAPHVIDPKYPGAVDMIINLGEYWDSKALEENREEIIKVIDRNSKFYKSAYKYLEAARAIQEDTIWKMEEVMDFGKLNVLGDNLIKEIFNKLPISENMGRERHLFGSAYTPTGWAEHTDTLLKDMEKTYYIKGEIGTGKTTMMKKIYLQAVQRGLDVEVFHTPLIPEKIETIIIKDLSIGLSIMDAAKDNNYKVIDLYEYIDKEIYNIYEDSIKESKEIYEKLISVAIDKLAGAKKNHDLMEAQYIPNMSYDEINKIRNKIIEIILRFEN
ncbi:PRK06851 family protein [Proteiniborus sp. MB09-C3]|uniref:PRK06851 family protein n=1 Tax=Proteiniborus sp. MB09-C3 TaxID=3050072 RepID=UPI00255535F3|nr:PRK06851 family protein [Proteiniborus sp. MB09-C3]WIV10643.1 PRK06851 family protein [Proteiniborus sp. MB09-C3]